MFYYFIEKQQPDGYNLLSKMTFEDDNIAAVAL